MALFQNNGLIDPLAGQCQHVFGRVDPCEFCARSSVRQRFQQYSGTATDVQHPVLGLQFDSTKCLANCRSDIERPAPIEVGREAVLLVNYGIYFARPHRILDTAC